MRESQAFLRGPLVAYVRATQLAKPDELTAKIHETLSSPNVRAGKVVAVDAAVLSRVEDQVLSRSAEALLEVRRRERATPAEVLAFQLS